MSKCGNQVVASHGNKVSHITLKLLSAGNGSSYFYNSSLSLPHYNPHALPVHAL